MARIPNWVGGADLGHETNEWIEKFNPHTGAVMHEFAASSAADVGHAIGVALDALEEWSEQTPVARGDMLFRFVG